MVVAENAGSIRLDVPASSTALYYLGDPAAFEKAVGKSGGGRPAT